MYNHSSSGYSDINRNQRSQKPVFWGKLILWVILFVFLWQDASAIMIQSRVDNGPWVKKAAIYPLKGQTVTLKVSKISGGNIRWYQIFPDISKYYKNANHPWEENAYQWVGFGKIDYHRKELKRFRGQWKIAPFEIRNSDHSGYYHTDVGSFWFQAEVEKNGKAFGTPGIKDSDTRGLSPKVFRISVRDGQGYLGYLTSFFNVPGVFGSVPYQSNNYIGADCADILIAAYGKWKGKNIKKNYNVAMLVTQFSKMDEFDLRDGTPHKQVRWGNKIRPGDFIAVRYNDRSQYQHIGALFKDADKNGILDGDDIVIHAGPFPLSYSYLREGSFDGHVRILRP